MSKKNSKRKIELLLQQTSATLSGEADERIRGKLGIQDKTMQIASAEAEETQYVVFSGKRHGSGRRISMGIAAALTVAAVVCAVLLTVWVKSLRKNTQSGNKGTGTESTMLTPVSTNTVTPVLSATPTQKPSDTPTPQLSATPTPKIIYMSSYLGQEYQVAIEKLQALDMKLQIIYEPATEYYEEYPIAGQVVGQFPNVGDPLTEGGTVKLIYSIEQELIEIGDYRGMTGQQVRSALDNKLFIRIDWVESDTIEENYVVSTQPGAGEKLPVGSTLTVVLSQGSSKFTEVPNVVGMKEVDAKATLIASGLDYSTEKVYNYTAPAGIVISQSPDSSAGKVEKRSVIKLTVSAGPESTEP